MRAPSLAFGYASMTTAPACGPARASMLRDQCP